MSQLELYNDVRKENRIMKVIYIADDGREFEDENECLRYENLKSEKTKNFLNAIHAFDEEGHEIKVDLNNIASGYDIEDMIGETIYVTFDSLEAYIFFDEQQEYYGYKPIHECIDHECENDDVFIYNDNGEWESAKEMIEHYRGILDKFKNKN